MNFKFWKRKKKSIDEPITEDYTKKMKEMLEINPSHRMALSKVIFTGGEGGSEKEAHIFQTVHGLSLWEVMLTKHLITQSLTKRLQEHYPQYGLGIDDIVKLEMRAMMIARDTIASGKDELKVSFNDQRGKN